MKYLLILAGISNFAYAKNQTFQQVLKEIYPKCELSKKIHYLTKKQVAEVEKKTKKRLFSKIKVQYTDPCSKDVVYIDSHIVRTLNETIVLSINKNKIKEVKIASFNEPQEYKPPQKWINALIKSPNDVDSLSGATLSENALKRSMIEIHSIHEVLAK